jgi:hypothetical protein
MSSTASPNPNNIILLAVLGIGAYYLMTRRAMAQPVAVRPGQQPAQSTTAAKVSALGAVANVLGGLFGSRVPAVNTNTGYYTGQLTGSQYAAAATASQNDSNPDLNGSVADWASSNTDGLAANPPGNSSAYDTWAEDAVYWN